MPKKKISSIPADEEKLTAKKMAAEISAAEVIEDADTGFTSPPLESELTTEVDTQVIKKKTILGTVSLFGTTIILNAVGLIANIFLMKFLSPADFGIYGFVGQINGLLVFFSDVGLASSLIQKKETPTARDYHTVFWTQQILAWVIFLISLIIIATGFVRNQVGLEGNWILLAIAISFPLMTLKTVSSIKLTRKMEFSKIVIPQIFEQLFYNIILITLALNGAGALSYAYAILGRSIVGVIVMFIIQPYWPRLAFSVSSFKQTIKFGVKFQANDLLARIKDNFFYLTIGSILPNTQFGYITWAKQWSMFPYNLTVQNVMNITFPTFSRLQHDKKLLAKAIEKSLFFITAVIFPIIAGMCLFITPALEVFPGYTKWLPAVPTFIFFTLGIAWSAISSPLTNTLNAIGEINKTLKLMVFWTILTWVLTFPLMWIFGFNGVALAAFLISFTSIIPSFMVKKIVKFKLWDNVWRQLFAALIMTTFVLVTYKFWFTDRYYLILGVICAAIVYGLSFLLLGRRKIFAEVRSLFNKSS